MDYEEYWRRRGFQISDKLKDRENIFLDWIPAGRRVLDVGCGNSRLPLVLKEKGCSVQVADLSKLVLDGYREHGISGQQVDLDSIADWVPPSGIFDYVILSEVLEHTRNPEEIIAKLKPLARHLVLSVPNSAFYRYRLSLLFRGRFFTQWAFHPSEHLRFWSHLDFLDWLRAMGLTVEKTAASNGFGGPVKNWWPNLFGNSMCYLARTENV